MQDVGGPHPEELCSRSLVYCRLYSLERTFLFSHSRCGLGSALGAHTQGVMAGVWWRPHSFPSCRQAGSRRHLAFLPLQKAEMVFWCQRHSHVAGIDDSRCGRIPAPAAVGEASGSGNTRALRAAVVVWFWCQHLPNLNKGR